jgi:pimeloyl-ACP methyl ester carboxylesterase
MRTFLIAAGVLLVLLVAASAFVSDPDVPRATLEAKYASAPSRFVTLPGGARVHVRDRGPREGLTLVLLHGSNASLFTWEPWAKRLGDTFRIVTIDLPAHGLTGAVSDADYSYEAMVTFVRDVVNALGVQRFAIGGNSMGGRLSALFAGQYPDRVTHLILVDPGGLPVKQVEPVPLAFRLLRLPILNRILLYITPRSIVVDALNEAVSHKEIITDEMVDRYWEFARLEGTREATIMRANIISKAITERLGNIKAPTLILWGEEDRVIPVDHAREFHARIPGSRLIVYPMTGHIPQEELPDQSASDVREFLSRAVSPPAVSRLP